MLCAAETAGGSCADPTCGDIHLAKGLIRGEIRSSDYTHETDDHRC